MLWKNYNFKIIKNITSSKVGSDPDEKIPSTLNDSVCNKKQGQKVVHKNVS